MIEAAGGAQHPPCVLLGIDEGEGTGDNGSEAVLPGVGSSEAVADPGVESADDAHLYGVDQAPSVPEVGVHEGTRYAGGLGDLVESDQQWVLLGEQALGGIDDEPAPGIGVEAGARPAAGAQAMASASEPLRLTMSSSPGASGW